MAKYVDLTLEFDENAPVYYGDPHPKITPHGTLAKDGANVQKLEFLAHSGTHIDAPYHMREDGKKLGDFPVEHFIGTAIVVDATTKNIKNEILPDLSQAKGADFVFFYTANSQNIHTQKYFENISVISLKTGQELLDLGVKIIGLDSFTPDKEPFETHKLLFSKNICIVENLTNIRELVGKKFECTILPLKLANADGAPCRVIAKL